MASGAARPRLPTGTRERPDWPNVREETPISPHYSPGDQAGRHVRQTVAGNVSRCDVVSPDIDDEGVATMSDASGPTGSVRRNDEANRYELTIDGRFAGLAAYLDRDGQRIFYHTEIEQSSHGHGLGSVLIDAALADAREDGKRVVGVCTFVDRYLSNHAEFDDIADPATPDVMRWLESALD